MTTQDSLLAAFLVSLNVPVKKIEENVFEFDLEDTNPLVAQFNSPDGYNCNIHKIATALGDLEAMEIYIAPEAPQE